MSELMADLTTRVLQKALDCTAAQQRVVAGNLANLETPGYVAREVRFEEQLRAAIRAEQRGDEHRGLRSVAPVTGRSSAAARADGNNVSLETEMLSLGEATLRYQMLTRMIDRRLGMLGTAIGDGRSG